MKLLQYVDGIFELLVNIIKQTEAFKTSLKCTKFIHA